MVDELSRASPVSDAMWRANNVQSHGEGVKTLRHPAGMLNLEYSTFPGDGRPDLSMVIYNPATAKDAELVRALLKADGKPHKGRVKQT